MNRALLTEATAIVAAGLTQAQYPVVWCSFGKDSSVVLDMVHKIRKTPVVHLRYPKFHEKYRWFQKMIERYDCEVYDLLPYDVTLFQDGTFFDVMKHYYIGQDADIPFSAGIIPYTPLDERYYCTIDVMNCPKSTAGSYPWDATFLGLKECDFKLIGRTATDMKPSAENNGAKTVFPLYNWNDEDVWDYIRDHRIPYDENRYDRLDHTENPDKVVMCYRCVDVNLRHEDVWCPKLERLIPNVAGNPSEQTQNRKDLLARILFATVTDG